MEITIAYLTEKFNEFNTLYFEGKLPRCLIQIDNTKRRFGCFRYNIVSGGKSIRISRYDGLRKEIAIQRTLIHEMIHLWQYVNYGSTDHRRTFKAMSAKIYKLSSGKFDIQRLSNPDLETDTAIVNTASKNITPFKVFMVHNKTTDKRYILSASSTAVIDIHNYFATRPDEWTITREWFSTDPNLKGLVRNRQVRKLKARAISQQEELMYSISR